MTTLRLVSFNAREQHGTALIAADDSVWVVVAPAWWDLASILWWWLCPIDRKAFAILATSSGQKVRARVIRVARKHVKIRQSALERGG